MQIAKLIFLAICSIFQEEVRRINLYMAGEPIHRQFEYHNIGHQRNPAENLRFIIKMHVTFT